MIAMLGDVKGELIKRIGQVVLVLVGLGIVVALLARKGGECTVTDDSEIVRAGTRIVEALKAHKTTHGVYPEKLDELQLPREALKSVRGFTPLEYSVSWRGFSLYCWCDDTMIAFSEDGYEVLVH